MKKKVLVFAAVMLMMCSTMTVFAQPSVNVDSVVEVDKVVDKNGEAFGDGSYDIAIVKVEGEDLAKAQDIVKPENLKTVLPEDEADDNWKAFAVEAIVVDEQNKEVHWTEAENQFPVQITFEVPDVTANSRVRVLHYYGGWHLEEVVATGVNAVTATFKHLSGPIVILVDNADVPDSPQTGENNAMLYVALIAVVALAGATVMKREQN